MMEVDYNSAFNAQNSPRSNLKNIPIFSLIRPIKWFHLKVLSVEELSFKWSHHTTSSTNSKVRTCLWNCVRKVPSTNDRFEWSHYKILFPDNAKCERLTQKVFFFSVFAKYHSWYYNNLENKSFYRKTFLLFTFIVLSDFFSPCSRQK